jgi:hypothetical protein
MRKEMTINLLKNNSCINCEHSTVVKRNVEITSVDIMSNGEVSVGSVGDLETTCLKFGSKTVDKDQLCYYWKEHGQKRYR